MGDDRTFFQRAFGPMRPGSMRGSIFNLSAAGIGSGVLSLSWVMSECGYITGPLFLLGAATACTVSLRMLTKLAVLGDINSYAKLCEDAGGKALGKLLSIMVIVQMFGVMIAF